MRFQSVIVRSLLASALLGAVGINPVVAQGIQSSKQNKISLDFQDIGVRQVLQLLGEYTQTNIAVADSVQGNITLSLKNVTPTQALDTVLQAKGLAKRRNGNIWLVAPLAEFSKSDDEQRKIKAQARPVEQIKTEYIRLHYAQAKDIARLMTEAKQNQALSLYRSASDQPQMQQTILSPSGSVSFDERTNTLIVSDTVHNLQQVRQMLTQLDIPVQQVLIEARIVRASTNFSKELGVKWGIFTSRDNGRYTLAGSDTTLWDLRAGGGDIRNASIERPTHLNVDLGVANSAAGSIAIGLLGLENFVLDLELSALQSDGYGEIISTPKVLTVDKQKASIVTGQEVPYQSLSQSGNTSSTTTSFKEALLKLDVTPSITPNGQVQMQLQVTNNTAAGYAQNGEIILNKNELNTNVLVKDGETIVLGGVYEHIEQNTQTKVPFFGDLPAVGRLFRKNLNSNDKRELLIFVTPRIVNDTRSLNAIR